MVGRRSASAGGPITSLASRIGVRLNSLALVLAALPVLRTDFHAISRHTSAAVRPTRSSMAMPAASRAIRRFVSCTRVMPISSNGLYSLTPDRTFHEPPL